MPQVLQPNNPFTLFLIVILLMLSTNPGFEEQLAFLKSLVQATQLSVRTFQNGLGNLHATMSQLFTPIT